MKLAHIIIIGLSGINHLRAMDITHNSQRQLEFYQSQEDLDTTLPASPLPLAPEIKYIPPAALEDVEPLLLDEKLDSFYEQKDDNEFPPQQLMTVLLAQSSVAQSTNSGVSKICLKRKPSNSFQESDESKKKTGRSQKLDLKTEFVCPACKTPTIDSRNLKQHILAKHTKLRPYVCNDLTCDHESFSDAPSLINHMKKAHNMKTHPRSDTLSMLSLEMQKKVSAALKPFLKDWKFQCLTCDALYFDKHSLSIHLGHSQHSLESLESLPEELKQQKRKFSVPFPRRSIKDAGTKVTKWVQEQPETKNPPKKEFMDPSNCTVCQKHQFSFANLKEHFLTDHLNYHMYLCENSECLYKTNIKSNFESHLRNYHGLTTRVFLPLEKHQEIAQILNPYLALFNWNVECKTCGILLPSLNSRVTHGKCHKTKSKTTHERIAITDFQLPVLSEQTPRALPLVDQSALSMHRESSPTPHAPTSSKSLAAYQESPAPFDEEHRDRHQPPKIPTTQEHQSLIWHDESDPNIYTQEAESFIGLSLDTAAHEHLAPQGVQCAGPEIEEPSGEEQLDIALEKITARYLTNYYKYNCPVASCQMPITELQQYKQHILNKHTEFKLYKCNVPGCTRETNHAADFKEHMRDCHQLSTSVELTLAKQKEISAALAPFLKDWKFKCKTCNALFPTQKSLKNHKIKSRCQDIDISLPQTQQHTEKQPEKDSKKRALSTQKSKNKYPRTFQKYHCPVPECQRSITQLKHFKDHLLNAHTQLKLYTCSCPECGYHSNHASDFKEHMAKYHQLTANLIISLEMQKIIAATLNPFLKDWEFKCQTCEELFPSQKSLKAHQSDLVHN